MTDVTVNLPSVSFGRRWITALLRRALAQATMARNIRHTLDELPDAVLEDIGFTRSDIPYVADALASGHACATRDAVGRLNWKVTERVAT